MVLDRSSLSRPLREKILTSTIMPSTPGGTVNDVSFTSPAFSPKMARSSFSSGVSCVSPFGVTFPTKIFPGFTSAPVKKREENVLAQCQFAVVNGGTIGQALPHFHRLPKPHHRRLRNGRALI